MLVPYALVAVKQGFSFGLNYGQISNKRRILMCSAYSDLSVDGAALIRGWR